MSMGYSGHEIVCIEEEDIEKMNLPSWTRFKMKMVELNVSMEDFAMYKNEFVSTIRKEGVEEELEEEFIEELIRLFDEFEREFWKKTEINLILGYHDSESYGSEYDELNGYYFELWFDDIFQPTEKAKKIPYKWKSFVVYG